MGSAQMCRMRIIKNPFERTPCGEPFFCAERPNRARKGLCDASLATRLLSAMLFKVSVLRALV